MFKSNQNFLLPRKICRSLGHERQVFKDEVLKIKPEDAKELLAGGYISEVKEEKEPIETPRKGRPKNEK